MDNALGLVFALPKWFFSTITQPFSTEFLSLVPAIGVICFGSGVILGIRNRDKRLLAFILPVLLSEMLVAAAGFMLGVLRGTASGPFIYGFLIYGFLIFQLLIVAYLVFKMRGSRVAATLLAVFSITYALFAVFIAGMALNDTWL